LDVLVQEYPVVQFTPDTLQEAPGGTRLRQVPARDGVPGRGFDVSQYRALLLGGEPQQSPTELHPPPSMLHACTGGKQLLSPAESNSQRDEQQTESLAQEVPFPRQVTHLLSVGEQNAPSQQSDEMPHAVALPAVMQLLH